MRAVLDFMLLLWRSCREATDEVPLVASSSLSTKAGLRVTPALFSGLLEMTV
jgi:hypothetical protein